MKTLREALDTVVPFYTNRQERAALTPRMVEFHNRYDSLYREIVEDERAREIVKDLLLQTLNGGISAETAIGTALLSGIFVGIEMQKSE